MCTIFHFKSFAYTFAWETGDRIAQFARDNLQGKTWFYLNISETKMETIIWMWPVCANSNNRETVCRSTKMHSSHPPTYFLFQTWKTCWYAIIFVVYMSEIHILDILVNVWHAYVSTKSQIYTCLNGKCIRPDVNAYRDTASALRSDHIDFQLGHLNQILVKFIICGASVFKF